MTETRTTAETTTNVIPIQTIDELVFKAHKQFEVVVTSQQKFFAARLACGQTLLELRARVEAGEVGSVKWWEWYGSRFARSRRDAERVMELASAEDPRATYEENNAARRQATAYTKAWEGRPGNGRPAEKDEEKQDSDTRVAKVPELKVIKGHLPKKPELRLDRLKLLEQGYRELTRDERYQHILDCHRVDKE